jgi:hypothetical protein
VFNTRCYRCGWSFTLSRETIAAALTGAASTGAKYHVEHCPRCRQAIKLPVDQLKRAAPPGWTSAAPEAQTALPAAVAPLAAPSPEPSPESAPASPAEAPVPVAEKRARKRGAAKPAPAGESKAPTAKKTTSSKPAAKKPLVSKKTK